MFVPPLFLTWKYSSVIIYVELFCLSLFLRSAVRCFMVIYLHCWDVYRVVTERTLRDSRRWKAGTYHRYSQTTNQTSNICTGQDGETQPSANNTQDRVRRTSESADLSLHFLHWFWGQIVDLNMTLNCESCNWKHFKFDRDLMNKHSSHEEQEVLCWYTNFVDIYTRSQTAGENNA